MSAAAASPVKAKKAAKPRKPADHPKYIEMITQAISALKERGGSSRQKIVKYIIANFKVDPANANQHVKMALKGGVKAGTLKQSKGVGAAGSFRVGEKAAKPKKAVKAKKAKKPAAKKPAGEKKAAKPKKSPAKKAKKPKSPKKAKSPAKKPKAAKAKPAKKAAAKKPAKKSPKKAAAKKK